jgi:hypothetical protein
MSQLNHAGAGLPETVAVAIAFCQPVGVLLAMGRAGQLTDFRLHQTLGANASRGGNH